ncbi:hypothetical protein K1X76_07770 [bacterium]|nr:hypothetical protein [bacterium]
MKFSCYMSSALLFLCMSCSSIGGSGTETANPVTVKPMPLAGKAYNLTVSSRNEKLQFGFGTDLVSIDRFATSNPISATVQSKDFSGSSLRDSQSDAYLYQDNTVDFETDFNDGTHYSVSLGLDADNNPSLTSFLVNGTPTEASLALVVGGQNPGTAEEALASGYAFLKTQDIVSAKNAYCNELVDEPANAQLAFGCAWLKMTLSIEEAPAVSILEAFNQPQVVVATNIFGPDGAISQYHQLAKTHGDYKFNYSDLKLPFSQLMRQNPNFSKLMAAVIKPLIDNNVSMATLQGFLKQLQPYFIGLESDCNKAVGDSLLDFVIPKEVYGTDNDLHAKQGDAYALLAVSQGVVAGLDMAGAYDYGVQFKGYLVKDSKINVNALTADLNGEAKTVGVYSTDNVPFLSLLDSSLITGQKLRFIRALQNAEEGLTRIRSAGSDFAPSLTEVALTDLLTTVQQAQTSLKGQFVSFTSLPKNEEVTINLKAFFDVPPNAQTMPVESGYPFVVEGYKMKLVESYFQTLLTGIIDIHHQ